MRARTETSAGQSGIGLVVALLVVLIASLITVGIMMTASTGTRVTGPSGLGSHALNLAEAGVAEAIARIRSGDVPDNGNPRMVAQIFLSAPGNVPALGPDSLALATSPSAGEWLDYSMPTRSDQVLTVQYKTDAAKTVIYRYDADREPSVQTVSGSPIYVVTSTGRKAGNEVRIVAEVCRKKMPTVLHAALATPRTVRLGPHFHLCGWNHGAATPAGTKGRGPCLGYELPSGHLPGAWSTRQVSCNDGSADGTPPRRPRQSGFYDGPWEALGMGQAEFFTWVGAPLSTAPAVPRGIVFLDDNSRRQDHSGRFSLQGGDGAGLLYVDGDLRIDGDFTFHGLIYVEGNLEIAGNAWVLGAVIVNGTTDLNLEDAHGAILYSEAAVKQNIAGQGGRVVTLSWREERL